MGQRDARYGEWVEFRPRQSGGRVWVATSGAAFFTVFITATYFAWGELHWILMIPFVVLGIGVTTPLLLLAWYFPTLRYWLGRKELVLFFGPIMYDRVPLDAIQSIRKRNLKPTTLMPTSLRFPGLALLYVDYIEFGSIRMSATSSAKQILLIDIGHRRYVNTPEDEMGLVQAIRERSTADIRVSKNFNPNRAPETAISR
jgi:hypothetical protein